MSTSPEFDDTTIVVSLARAEFQMDKLRKYVEKYLSAAGKDGPQQERVQGGLWQLADNIENLMIGWEYK